MSFITKKKTEKAASRVPMLIPGRKVVCKGRGAGPGCEHSQRAVWRPSQGEEQRGWCGDPGPPTSDNQPRALVLHHSKPIINPSQQGLKRAMCGKRSLWGEAGPVPEIKPGEDISNTARSPVDSNLCLQHRDHLIRTSLPSLLGHQGCEPQGWGGGREGVSSPWSVLSSSLHQQLLVMRATQATLLCRAPPLPPQLPKGAPRCSPGRSASLAPGSVGETHTPARQLRLVPNHQAPLAASSLGVCFPNLCA